MKNKLEKPEPRIIKCYDYNACRDYLQEKYDYDERDYAGRYKRKNGKVKECNLDIEYLDFWHWVCEHHEVHNGCFITFCREVLEDEQTDFDADWQKEIYKHYIDEFADEKGEVELYCWW